MAETGRELPRFPWSATSRWRPRLSTLAVLLVGLWLFGTAEALLVTSHLGNSPWTVLAEGVERHTPLTIGAATLLIGVAVLLAWVPLRERPGLGTVLNVLVISAALELGVRVLPTPATWPAKLAEVGAAIVLLGMGSALYLSSALGPGPRDGWMTGIHRRSGWPIAAIRAGIESSALLLGWLLGGRVGIGTIVFAVLVGPSVATGLRLLGAIVRTRPAQVISSNFSRTA